jgi:hypothetical protein
VPEGKAGGGDRRNVPVGGDNWGGGDCRCSGVWSEGEGSSPDRSCNLAWNEIAPFVVLISPYLFLIIG